MELEGLPLVLCRGGLEEKEKDGDTDTFTFIFITVTTLREEKEEYAIRDGN